MYADPEWAPCATCSCVDGDASFEQWEIKGVLPSTRRCPRRLISPASGRWLELHTHYAAGHLAVAGGILEQPAKYVEAMRLIQQVIARG